MQGVENVIAAVQESLLQLCVCVCVCIGTRQLAPNGNAGTTSDIDASLKTQFVTIAPWASSGAALFLLYTDLGVDQTP